MSSAMSNPAWNAAARQVWERDGKRCVRCNKELPDVRDGRPDAIVLHFAASDDPSNLRTLCPTCYVLRGEARRWRTANIGVMVAAGTLPSNWRELVWDDAELEPAD